MDRTGLHIKHRAREATVVIPRAGRQHKSQGESRAAEKPNLLNVAVSRAKQRIYVIGERALWVEATLLFHRCPGTGKAGCR